MESKGVGSKSRGAGSRGAAGVGAAEPEGPARGPGEPAFASYQPAVQWLMDRVNIERVRAKRLEERIFKLDRMRALMDALDHPEHRLRVVHVAGSKGKGSVCEMTASMLASCGYTVGLYTSPHLIDVRERIRVLSGVRPAPSEIDAAANGGFAPGELISYPAFTSALGRVHDAIGSMPAKVRRELGEPTYFEVLTAAAFCHFAEQAVDLAVVEVGLGGRLDATNVVTPEVCGLTSIQLEHTDILGDTLEVIAAEKAGIMKPGVPVITIPQPKGVLQVFRDAAERAGARLLVLGKDVDYSTRFEVSPELGPHMRVCAGLPKARDASGNPIGYEHLAVPLKGEHQAANCGLALAMVCQLVQGGGLRAPERDIAHGLARTSRHARMEVIWDRPRIMIDGAHNPDSIEALVRGIGANVACDSMVVIFGCSADKDVDGLLAQLGRGGDKVIFTRSTNPRAVDPVELRDRFEHLTGKTAQAEPDLKAAINTAARAVGRDDLILVTGSFYLAGEAKKLVINNTRRRRQRVRETIGG